MDLQLRLNTTDRGWLETTYFQLGSDDRGNLPGGSELGIRESGAETES